MNQTSQREVLLKRVQVCAFVLNDTALYLDTHPDDQQALAYFKKYTDLKAVAHKEFAEKYGPILQSDNHDQASWRWVEEPWPWQSEEE